MKHIIEFNLPEEQEELQIYMNGPKLSSVMFDFENQVLRANIKHGLTEDAICQLDVSSPEEQEEVIRVFEYIRSKYFDLMREHGVES